MAVDVSPTRNNDAQLSGSENIANESECSRIASPSLRIVSWNLLNFVAPPNAAYEQDNIYSSERWAKKCQWISHYIVRHQPDVIGFQEVFSPQDLASLLSPLGYHLVSDAQPSWHGGYIGEKPIVALASRHPVVVCRSLAPNHALMAALGVGSEVTFSRPPLQALLELPFVGKTWVIVVHLKSRRKDDNVDSPVASQWKVDHQRSVEALLIADAVSSDESRELSNLPCIVMGDFNDPITSDLLRPLGEHPRLRDSWDVYADWVYSDPSWPQGEVLTRLPTHYWGEKGRVLDYILLSEAFQPNHLSSLCQVSQFAVDDDHVVRPSYVRDSESTDHAIVRVDIQPRR